MGCETAVVGMVWWLLRGVVVVVVFESLAMLRKRLKEDWTMRVVCMYRIRSQQRGLGMVFLALDPSLSSSNGTLEAG